MPFLWASQPCQPPEGSTVTTRLQQAGELSSMPRLLKEATIYTFQQERYMEGRQRTSA